MSDTYFLPQETENALKKQLVKCQNFGLVLDKYIPLSVVLDSAKKGPWLREQVHSNHVDAELVKAAYQRWYAMMKAKGATLFTGEADWRMVVGLGGESVLETDITLHHLYGVPFIPGSALKGLVRSYTAMEEPAYFVVDAKDEGKLKPSLKEETDHEDIKEMFGTQEHAGTVVFFDAMPENGVSTFVVDIMNPHYPDYYNALKSAKPKAPTNDQSPNPVTFLAVEKTTFTFALAPRDPYNPEHKKHVEKVKELLSKALQKYGVGGKTSAGYGYFKGQREEQKSGQQPVREQQRPQQPWQRPNRLPQFQKGQSVSPAFVMQRGIEHMQQIMPNAHVFLRYQEFPPNDVFIAVQEEVEGVENWHHGDQKKCLFDHEELHDHTLVLICMIDTSSSKKKDKKKK